MCFFAPRLFLWVAALNVVMCDVEGECVGVEWMLYGGGGVN